MNKNLSPHHQYNKNIFIIKLSKRYLKFTLSLFFASDKINKFKSFLKKFNKGLLIYCLKFII